MDTAEILCDELDEHPPTHLMVAAYLGVKPKKSKRKKGFRMVESEGLGGVFGGMLSQVAGLPKKRELDV